ncbi:hypothetical protein ACET3Z_000411 [Daucus carota]
MVGLADIPCVGKVVDRISDAAVDALFRGFRYMFCYKDLVKTLDSQVENANTEEERVSRKVTAERANEAVKKTERLTELINSGKELLANEIAYLAPAENLPKGNTEFQEFQSRKDSYGELWRVLTTDSSPIVGIYGMPGVGKSRMMEQVWKEAREKNIFNKVTRANVGNEKLDVIQLQTQIAGYLDCNFVSEVNAERRASQLKQSLLNAGKTLVILDDVWREIPLDVIGIPCGSKILLTSREEKVCLSNKCQTHVKITPLWPDEAWDQFKNIVGPAQIDSMHDESLAKKVCNKCGGLPLLIHAIGKALQFETHNSWVDAFEQLEKGESVNIPGVEPQVYACVELSINKLHGDAKSCLFLCCLFDEDADIPIRKLIRLATGSQLVSGESRVLSMVDTLISSSLLLDSREDDRIKLHDIIRDVGRSIAFRDSKFAFSHVTCDVRLLDDADVVTTKFLRLDLNGDNIHIPDDLVCPDLHSLWLNCNNHIQQFSGGFFSMSANLSFLYLGGAYFRSKLQISLQPLGKLRTLIFDYCDLGHIINTNVGFFPENLETLSILDGYFPQPLDLSNLKYLRKLEINWSEVKMMPNSISSLSRLEQLRIPQGFEIWSDDSSAVAKPILVEINKLTHLKSLQIKFKRTEPFQNTNILDNLKLFNIRVDEGESSFGDADLCYKTSIELHGYCEESLKSLVEKAEYVSLKRTGINVKFPNLAKLEISSCKKIKLESIEFTSQLKSLNISCDDEIQLPSEWQPRLHNLETLILSGCWSHDLKSLSFQRLKVLKVGRYSGGSALFTFSGFRSLQQLQELEISDCAFLEEIAEDDEMSGINNKTIALSHLGIVILKDLPNLKSIIHGANYGCHVPSLWKVKIENCGLSSIFSFSSEFTRLRRLEISSCAHLEEIVKDVRSDEVSGMNKKTITLSHFNCGLSSLFMCSASGNLQSLTYLRVQDCRMLEGIFEYARGDETSDTSEQIIISLPKLRSVELINLPDLKSFIHGTNHDWYMPALKSMEVDNCGFSTLFTCSNLTNLLKLKDLKVSNCRMLEDIVEDARGDETCGTNDKTVTLPLLKRIGLKHLPNLKSFSRDESYAFNCALEFMAVDNCGFSTLFTFSVFRNLLKLTELEVSNCRLLEVVVEDATGDETSDTNDKTVTLPLLRFIKLDHLPNLKSFSGDESIAFNMLELKNLSLVGCPGVENFTCLNTHTGNGYVRTDGDEWKEVPNLNEYIKSLFKKEDVAVPENQRDSKMKSLGEP